jgi:hypothetical protein
MDRQTRALAIGDPTVASVYSYPHSEPERLYRADDALACLDRCSWLRKDHEEAVTARVHLLAAEAGDLVSNRSVMALEEDRPRIVTERDGLLRRADNVRKERANLAHAQSIRRLETSLPFPREGSPPRNRTVHERDVGDRKSRPPVRVEQPARERRRQEAELERLAARGVSV